MVYIRVETTLGTRVSLLCAKTKVTPLKKLSIPRFDGCISLKGRVSIDCVYYCWDSEVAFCWVKGK